MLLPSDRIGLAQEFFHIPVDLLGVGEPELVPALEASPQRLHGLV